MSRCISKKHKEEYKDKPNELNEFITKMASHVFKATYYTIISSAFVYLLQDQRLLPWYFGGDLATGEPPVFFIDYPCRKMPDRLLDLYVFKIGYYIYETIYSVIFYRHRHDFTENQLHHVVTLGLVSFSYWANYFDFGAVIYFLTSVTDIPVSLMRISYFWDSTLFKYVSFIGMLGSFIVFRDIY